MILRKIVYVDNAATSKVRAEVIESMIPFLSDSFGNPSSIYSIGREAKRALEKARKTISECINASEEEIIFTSCGSESDNFAIKSSYESRGEKNHIITSKIEHHAVLKTVKSLKNVDSSYISPDEFGVIKPETLEKEIRKDTFLVSIMHANNEIGTLEPIEELSEVCRKNNVIFHTDAVQSVGHVEVDVKKLGVDMLSASAHKFNGPKGVGFLYIKKGLCIPAFISGGAQERNLRAGTENVSSIVGMAKALEISVGGLESNKKKLDSLQSKLVERVLKIDKTILTGHPKKRIPGSCSFCFLGVEGESILLNLDQLGICASSGSACTSGSLDPSHVLLSIGLSHEVAHGSLRITLGHENTMEDVDYICDSLPPIINKLRVMSPVWEKYSKR